MIAFHQACDVAQTALDNLNIPRTPLDTASILRTPIPSREPRRMRLESALLEAEAECAAIDALADKLAAIKQQTDARRFSISHALTPVFAIPLEVIDEIFELAVKEIVPRTAYAKSISQVCALWRDVMLRKHDLWSIIMIQDRAKLSTNLVDACVRRSKGKPLSAFLDFDSSSMAICQSATARMELEYLTAAFLRKDTFEYAVPKIIGFDDDPWCYPAVREMMLAFDLSYPDAAVHLPDRFTDAFPSLRDLSLFFAPSFSFHKIGQGLSCLRIQSPPSHVGCLFSALEHCRNLEELVLEDVDMAEVFEALQDIGNTYLLPRLELLHLTRCHHLVYNYVLTHLRAPKLLQLGVDIPEFDQHTAGGFGANIPAILTCVGLFHLVSLHDKFLTSRHRTLIQPSNVLK